MNYYKVKSGVVQGKGQRVYKDGEVVTEDKFEPGSIAGLVKKDRLGFSHLEPCDAKGNPLKEKKAKKAPTKQTTAKAEVKPEADEATKAEPQESKEDATATPNDDEAKAKANEAYVLQPKDKMGTKQLKDKLTEMELVPVSDNKDELYTQLEEALAAVKG